MSERLFGIGGAEMALRQHQEEAQNMLLTLKENKTVIHLWRHLGQGSQH